MNAARVILLPFSWMYGCIIWLRNICYDAKIFSIHTVRVPVISVGNLTAGGTGKTPFVEYILRYLVSRNKKVSVISRGYKRSTKGTVIVSDGLNIQANADMTGDEPFQIAKKFPSAVVIVDEQRARAAQIAVEKYGSEVIVLDDGFQHRALARDLDIVLIDGRKDLNMIPLLPAGLRREPFSALRRATLLAVTRSADFNEPYKELQRHTSAPVIHVGFRVKKIVNGMSSQIISVAEVQDRSCIAFCGIGNPESFRATLDENRIHVSKFLTFPDHHRYSSNDLQEIEEAFKTSGSQMIMTTEKDAVRFSPEIYSKYAFLQSMYYLEIEAVIHSGESVLHEHIDTLLK